MRGDRQQQDDRTRRVRIYTEQRRCVQMSVVADNAVIAYAERLGISYSEAVRRLVIRGAKEAT